MKAQLFGKYRKGSSTLEILIAFAVLALTLTAVISVVFGNQSVAVDTQTDNEALYKAEAQLEVARSLSRQNFALVQSLATTTDDIYKKSISVTDISSSTKQVTSYISWSEGGRSLYVRLTTLLNNWLNPSSKCSPVLSGNWTAPQVYGYTDIVSNTGATGLDAHGTKLYLTSDPSAAGTDDFYIIDVSNASPTKGSLPILSEFSTSYGLTDVKVSGTNAYVAAHSTAFQFLVIDVTNSSSLSTSSIRAKLDVTAAGDTAIGNTLAYANGKVYLGLTKSSGPEFYVVDVSNPASPQKLGSYKVGAAVNQILVQDNIAYLATASTTPLIVLNVSNPNSPAFVTKSRTASLILSGQSVALAPYTSALLYLGMIGGNASPKLSILATSSLSGTPVWASQPSDFGKQSGVYRMVFRSGLLFMTTADPKDGFQIWNVSNPVAPVRYDTTPLNIQQSSTAGMDCFSNLLYIGQRSNRALQIIGPS